MALKTGYLTERCILFGAAGPPMLPEPYNNNYQIVQSRGLRRHRRRNEPRYADHSAGRESASAAANQPMDRATRAAIGKATRWLWIPRISRFNNQSRFGVGYLDGMTDQNLHVVERFRRADPNTIIYQATIDDPTVYTKPWTVEFPWRSARTGSSNTLATRGITA